MTGGRRKGQRIKCSELETGRQGEALQAALGKSQTLGAVGKEEEVESTLYEEGQNQELGEDTPGSRKSAWDS